MTTNPTTHNQEEYWQNRKMDILQQLSKQELAALYGNSQKLAKTRGEEVLPDMRQKVYILDQGYLRVCRINEDGKRLILTILGPGDFFGAITEASTDPDPEEFYEVVRDVKIISIDAEIFQKTLKNHPDMMMRLAQILEKKQRVLEKRITSMLFKDVCARTAELLIELATKYGEPCTHQPGEHQDIALTHQEIADLVGATRPVVSSILSDMTKANILEKHSKVICLKDMERLYSVANQGIKAFTKA